MFNTKAQFKRGASFIEVLVALTIFIVGIITVVSLIVNAQNIVAHELTRQQAMQLAQEGIEVARALYQTSPDSIPAGVYGLSFSEGEWSLTSESQSIGVFTRTLTVSDVSVTQKQIECEVAWNISTVYSGSVVLSAHVYDSSEKGGLAGSITLSGESAFYSSSTTIATIDTYNESESPIILTHMSAQWNGEATLNRITIEGVDVYAVGASSGAISGELIDIVDVSFSPRATTTVDELVFSADMLNAQVLVTEVFSDGTQKHSTLAL